VSPTRSLVVGSGGLLGKAVTAELQRRDRGVARVTVPWSDRDESVRALRDAVVDLVTGAGDEPWNLFWCAGTGVVATGEAEFDAERLVIEEVLEQSSRVLEAAGGHAGNGTVFFASSAGATFAGSSAPPFTESTDPEPLAPYGRGKLQLEEAFAVWAAASGARLLVGRISNLYGPGQNIAKPQGLISQLIAARLEERTSNIYVPMTTVRDYLYVDDGAAMIVDAVDLVTKEARGTRLLKVFAAQQGHSITQVIAELENVLDRRLDIVSGHDPAAVYQALDLRFRSVVLTEVDDRRLTPLAAGMAATAAALAAAHVRSSAS
jgi:UDP-glucose 4-epimerase